MISIFDHIWFAASWFFAADFRPFLCLQRIKKLSKFVQMSMQNSSVSFLQWILWKSKRAWPQCFQATFFIWFFGKKFSFVILLLRKLEHYGIRQESLKWLKSYLENRKQYVNVNGNSSKFSDITCGVPQSSVLGPLLFLIYIH